MTVTAEESRLYGVLRFEGASAAEAAIVLSIVRGFDAIELARTPSWVNEKRGPDGRWTRSGGGSSPIMQASARQMGSNTTSASILARQQAARQREQAAKIDRAARAADSLVTPASIRHENVAVSEAAARNHAQNVLAQAQTQISHIGEQLQAAKAAEEDQKHRVKLALHALVIAAGAALAMVLAKMDLSPAIDALGAAAPLLIQELIDWKKKL